jgi:hypothetical protein
MKKYERWVTGCLFFFTALLISACRMTIVVPSPTVAPDKVISPDSMTPSGSITQIPQMPQALLTATPFFDLNITGTVYELVGKERRGIKGAHLAYICTVPRAFSAISGTDGQYQLFVPASYARGLPPSDHNMDVTASGYKKVKIHCVMDDPFRPMCDFELTPILTPSETGTPFN